MKKLQFLTILTSLLFVSNSADAQLIQKWSLNQCITYALKNNIDVKSATASMNESVEDLKQAKESIFPTLSFSTNQSLVNQKIDDGSGNFSNNGSYSGSYSISSGVTLYNGGVILNGIKQKELSLKNSSLSIEVSKNSIEISVTQAYLQILYANESLKSMRESVILSEAQAQRAKYLFDAGSVSSVELAQFESQLSNDKYQLTVAVNTLAKAKLTLKQILELGIDEEFDILIPEIDDNSVMEKIPSVSEVYVKALEIMPQIEQSKISIENSKLGEKIASASAMPSVSLNASIGTGNSGNSGFSFSDQLNNRLNQNLSLSLSIPIYNKRSVKTQINKSRIQTEKSILNNQIVEKQLLATIEGLYQEAVSAQSRYITAKDKLQYYTQSFNLVNEQFNEGLKNTVELMTERKNYLSAQQEVLEAKFNAILSLKLLKFYQNESIELL